MDIVAISNIFLRLPYSAIVTLAITPFGHIDTEHFWRKWVEYNYNNEDDLSAFDISNWSNVARILNNNIYRLLKVGDIEYVRLGLCLGADPSDNNSECLLWQVERNNEECAEELLNDGRADPSQEDMDGWNVFHHAVMNDLSRIVNRLLNDPRIDPTIREEYIMDALTESYHEVLDLIIADGRIDITRGSEGGALENAIYNKQAEVVRSLLKDPRILISHYDLEYAVEYADADTVRVLLDDGRYDPSFNDSNVLDIARNAGRDDIVKLLLEDGRVSL